MMPTQQQVKEALKQVIYFKKQNNIVDLNMVHEIAIKEGEIAVTIIFADLIDPAINIISSAVEKTLKSQFGENFAIMIKPVTEAELGIGPLAGVKNIIAVLAGKGGVGKSTVAANLAITLAKTGFSVGILDADIMGPSVPMMFGVEGMQPGVMERDGKTLMVPLENYGVKILSLGFFVNPNQALMWRGSMINNAFNQLMKDSEWGNLDFLVIDMPPGTGDIQLTLAQSYKVKGTVLVTTPQKVAVADVRRAAMMYRQEKLTIPLLGIVENMSYFIPEDMPDKKYFIFGTGAADNLAKELDIPVLGRIPIVEKIVETGDGGAPISLNNNSPIAKEFVEIAANIRKRIELL
jgi:ATP-binding protein involved in chromosome partitioning